MPTWKDLAVALALICAIAAIMLVAMFRYDEESALRIWAAMGPLIGLITGAMARHFFSGG
jgi:hypothetical protein